MAERKYKDDVPETLKSSRLVEVIDKQRANSLQNNLDQIGKLAKVLVEGYSKKSKEDMSGRDERNSVVVFPKGDFDKGQYVLVRIKNCTSSTLLGEVEEICKPNKN